MTEGAGGRRLAGPWFLIAGLAIIATGRALGNGFAFDDIPIILENAQVHSLAPPWVYAQQSYWPPKNLGDAYRPWTVWWFAVQWALSAGAPWFFHTMNLILTVAVSLAVYLLLRRLVGAAGAVGGAALFAVHPVHVEATANVVGQGELWMTLFVVIAAAWYLDVRGRGRMRGFERIGLAGLLVLAAASKEQGVVLPVLLAALEWCRPDPRPWRQRWREVAPLYGLLAIVGIGFVAGRYAVLGDLGGGPPAAGLEGLGFAGRVRVMVPLIPDVARLLVWPRDLLAQYSPPAYGGSIGFGLGAWLGVAIVVGSAAAVWLRRGSVLALALLWIAVGWLPVSNLPFPTGVLIAERTLFLPSVGIAMVIGVMVDTAIRRERTTEALLVLVALGLAGAVRSWARQGVWRDNLALFAQTVIDEPRSYRSHLVLAKELTRGPTPLAAVAPYRRAAALYQGDARVYEEWGQLHRAAGRCDLAIPILSDGLAHHPNATTLRSRLFECLMTAGAVDRAFEVAQAAVASGMTEFTEPLARATRARSAPPAPPAASRPIRR